jgi:hypothetical protein
LFVSAWAGVKVFSPTKHRAFESVVDFEILEALFQQLDLLPAIVVWPK